MLSEEEKIDLYKVMGSPYFWRRKAKELKFSAEILFPVAKEQIEKSVSVIKDKNFDPDEYNWVHPTYMALIGFSTECLFKAAIIRDNPAFVSNGKLAKSLKTHNLIKLAKLAKIHLTYDEEKFCEEAYEYMEWYRYPIPYDIKEKSFFESSITNRESANSPPDEIFTELFNRICPTIGRFGN